jgi:hypothetical protein
MITQETKKLINKHVDDFIDEMRLEVIYIDSIRDIKEVSSGKFIIQDTDLVIDTSRSYDEILHHPIEDYFIPETVDLYVVEFTVELELPELTNLTNFDVSGVIHQEEIPIEDLRISDDQLRALLNYTCFDVSYQKMYPEVRPYLEDIYKKNHPENIQKFLERVKPLLGI